MRSVSLTEAETQLSRLLERAEAGERVVIARAGKPVAILGPYETKARRRELGQFAGEVRIAEDFDELPPDIEAAFGMTS